MPVNELYPHGRAATVDVITVCFNSASTLAATIDSVRRSKRSINRYIVVDGMSSDGTVGVIQSNLDVIDVYVSEPDKGISDAFNKGIALSNADYLLLLNADDRLIDEGLESVIAKLDPADEIVSTRMVSALNGRKVGVFCSDHGALPKRNSMLHPGCLIAKEVYRTVGLYDTGLRIAMDYDFFSRCFISDVKFRNVNVELVEFAEGGRSDSNFLVNVKEYYLIRRRYFGAWFPGREAVALFRKSAKYFVNKTCQMFFAK